MSVLGLHRLSLLRDGLMHYEFFLLFMEFVNSNRTIEYPQTYPLRDSSPQNQKCIFFLLPVSIYQSRWSWCELPRDFCLFSNIMGLSGAHSPK